MASVARIKPWSTTRIPSLPAHLVLLVSVSCSQAPGLPETFIVEHMAGGESGVATDLIFPVAEGASRFLTRNWPPQQTLVGNSMWVHGSWATIQFSSVADYPPTFVAEARPYFHPGAPIQVMDLFLNDQWIESIEMKSAWHTYRLPLPAAIVNIGWNSIELRFSQTLRPADFDAESRDRRALAAEFRRLELVGASGRGHWPERPDEVVVDNKEGLSSAAIEMPTDSYVQVHLEPGRNARLTGIVETRFDDVGGGSIRGVVEVLDADGPLRIWESELFPGASRALVAADLSGWWGQAIDLRLRVFGDVNAVVRWTGLGTSSED